MSGTNALPGAAYSSHPCTSGATRPVGELKATPGTDQAGPLPVKTISTVTETQHGNHNGGQIAFGPDGYLYIGFGDDLETITLQSISSFGEDANGELYIVDHAGDIYLVEAE